MSCITECSIMMADDQERTVLRDDLGHGPKGLGDPDSTHLRKIEIEVMIPKLIREKAKTEKCVPEVAAFNACCKDASLAMVYKCRNENSMLKNCLIQWYSDKDFKKSCEEQYLRERSEYRRTGITKKDKHDQNINTRVRS